MKPILPSLKEKKRYVVFETISEKKLSKNIVEKTINEYVLKFLGELGVAKSGFIFIRDSYKENKGVVKTNVKNVDEVKMALSLIKKVGNEKAIVNVVGVSGILKKAKSKFGKGE